MKVDDFVISLTNSSGKKALVFVINPFSIEIEDSKSYPQGKAQINEDYRRAIEDSSGEQTKTRISEIRPNWCRKITDDSPDDCKPLKSESFLNIP